MATLCPESVAVVPGMCVLLPRLIRTAGGGEFPEGVEMEVERVDRGDGPVKEFASLRLPGGARSVVRLPVDDLIPVVPE